MQSIGPEIWFPVVTLIVGLVLKGLFDFFTERRATKREREARSEERRQTALLKHVEFQRETLLTLQDATAKFMGFFGTAYLHDRAAFLQGASWGQALLPKDVDQGFHAAEVDVNRLRVRISDDKVREMSLALKTAAKNALTAGDMNSADALMSEAAKISISLNERIGELLRNLHAAELGLAEPE